jgi:hypothetical protein
MVTALVLAGTALLLALGTVPLVREIRLRKSVPVDSDLRNRAELRQHDDAIARSLKHYDHHRDPTRRTTW